MEQKGDSRYNDGANSKDGGKNVTTRGGGYQDADKKGAGTGGDAGYNDGANSPNTNNNVQPGQSGGH